MPTHQPESDLEQYYEALGCRPGPLKQLNLKLDYSHFVEFKRTG